MSGTITRLAEDSHLYSPDEPASTQIWLVQGEESPVNVDTLIGAAIPLFDEFGNPFIDARPEHKGAGIWIVEARFGAVPPLATGLTLWDIDTTGGREKRYQSLQTRFVQPSDRWLNTGAGVIDFAGAIGVNETQVEGVDVPVPKMAITAKRKYKTTDLPSGYVASLETLTAKTNAAAFTVSYWGQVIPFAVGELLFLGAVVTIATQTELEIDYKFEASRDRLVAAGTGETLVGFSEQVSKPGWDYAWLSYMSSTSAGSRTKVSQQYQSEKVIDTGDFTVLIL